MVLLPQAVTLEESVTDVVLQVIGPLLEVETTGVQTLDMTTVLAEAVHPPDCVTVTVYVPGVVTVVAGVMAPLLQT